MQQFQWKTSLYIPSCFRVFYVPFGQQVRSQFLSFQLCLLPHHPVYLEHKHYEVALSLKARLKIFPLFLLLVLRHYFVWVSPIIGLCVCFNNNNVKDTNPKRVPVAKHSRIHMEISANLAFLCIGIPPCSQYLVTPPSSGSIFTCCSYPVYFGLGAHCIWGIPLPTHLCPLFVQDIIPNTYKPPPISAVCILRHNGVTASI